MIYYIGVYVLLTILWPFLYGTPKNKAEFFHKNVFHPVSENTWHEVGCCCLHPLAMTHEEGKSNCWSENLHVDLELMWENENI